MGGQEAREASAVGARPRSQSAAVGVVGRDAASITVTRVTGTVPAGGARRARRRGASASVTTTTSRTSSPAKRRTT